MWWDPTPDCGCRTAPARSLQLVLAFTVGDEEHPLPLAA
jgi:hypothetical protein